MPAAKMSNELLSRSSLVLCTLLFLGVATLVDAALITNLPGQPPNAPFKQYSGYVTINKTTGKRFFYWFVEAVTSPKTKPLSLWLTGGPGCSGIGNGFFQELGPWRLAGPAANKLDYNPNAWNTVANMIFIDSPAGVGYSYSNTASDYITSDYGTAKDNYAFLQGFLEAFPTYRSHDFYLTGESYAGRFVPHLALLILQGNTAGRPKINLKGFAVGNAATDDFYDNKASFDAAWSHAIISDSTYAKLNAHCNYFDQFYPGNVSDACNDILNNEVLPPVDYIDVYSIYTPWCSADGSADTLPKVLNGRNLILRAMADRARKAAAERKGRRLLAAADSTDGEELVPAGAGGGAAPAGVAAARHLAAFNPGPPQPQLTSNTIPPPLSHANVACDFDWCTTYLNQEKVKVALHAKTNLHFAWANCADAPLNYTLKSDFPGETQGSVVNTYKKLFKYKGLRIWVYSGDTDLIVPFSGTRIIFGQELKLSVVDPWRAWYFYDQVGGYVTKFAELSLLTVRGAGHLVPRIQPERALSMFQAFLKGEDLRAKPFSHV